MMQSAEHLHPGLYIHIPFCLSKCHYCNFYSVTSTELSPRFLEALLREVKQTPKDWDPFDTIYIGGGTPSILAPDQLQSILAHVHENFPSLPGTEVTLEMNPGDLNLSCLQELREIGVNRLSIGVQSFDDTILSLLGRRHTARQAISAIENSRLAGFENIGLDLIYAIPGQGLRPWKKTLHQALAFSPEHLSCYQMTIEGDTALGKRYQKGELQFPGEKLLYDFFMKTSEWLEEAGYLHYEVSNFARTLDLASRHNQKYWNHTPYLGLGPGAHSFRERERWWNHSSLSRYLSEIESDRSPVAAKEILTDEQRQLEALFLGLRTKKGISLRNFAEEYHFDLLAEKKDLLHQLRKDGFLLIDNDHLVPTRAGLAVADRLALI